MTTEEKLQHFTAYTMEEARKNCDNSIREYTQALEQIFKIGRASCRERV